MDLRTPPSLAVPITRSQPSENLSPLARGAPTPVVSRLAKLAGSLLKDAFGDVKAEASEGGESAASAGPAAVPERAGRGRVEERSAGSSGEEAGSVEGEQAVEAGSDGYNQAGVSRSVLRGEGLEPVVGEALAHAANRIAFALEASPASGALALEQQLGSLEPALRHALVGSLGGVLGRLSAQLGALSVEGGQPASAQLEALLASLGRAGECLEPDDARALASAVLEGFSARLDEEGSDGLAALIGGALAAPHGDRAPGCRIWTQLAFLLAQRDGAALADPLLGALADAAALRRSRFERAMARLRKLERRLARLLRRHASRRWTEASLARIAAAFQEAHAEDYEAREEAAGELAALLPGLADLLLGSDGLEKSEVSRALCHGAVALFVGIAPLFETLVGQQLLDGWLQQQTRAPCRELQALALVTTLVEDLAQRRPDRLVRMGIALDEVAGAPSPFVRALSSALVRSVAPRLYRAGWHSPYEGAALASRLVLANAPLLGLTSAEAPLAAALFEELARSRTAVQLRGALRQLEEGGFRSHAAVQALALCVALPFCERQAGQPEALAALAGTLCRLGLDPDAVAQVCAVARRPALRLGELPPALAITRGPAVTSSRLATTLGCFAQAVGEAAPRTASAEELRGFGELLGLGVGEEVTAAVLEAVLGLRAPQREPLRTADDAEDPELALLEELAGASSLRIPAPVRAPVLQAVPAGRRTTLQLAKASGA